MAYEYPRAEIERMLAQIEDHNNQQTETWEGAEMLIDWTEEKLRKLLHYLGGPIQGTQGLQQGAIDTELKID